MTSTWARALTLERQAQDTFTQLLDRDPRGAWGEFEQIGRHLVEERLLFGDKPLPVILSPLVVARSRWQVLTAKLEKLHRILSRVEPLLHEKRWLDWLEFREDEQRLVQMEHQMRAGYTISRIDGFLGEQPDQPDDYKIVELNIDSPGGGAFTDVATTILERSPLWQEFSGRCPGGTIPFSETLYDHLEQVWTVFLKDNPHLSSASGKPRVAIVDWITVSTHREFELIAQGLEERGFSTLVADPRELEYRDGRLRCYDGKPIDLVYRRVLVEDMLRDPTGSKALVDASRERAVCLINTFASKPLTVKSLLALMHDPLGEQLFSGEELEVLHDLVPLTLKLTHETLPRVRAEKDRFVLKPADGWGAQGLYLGWRCTEQEWYGHLRRSVAVGGFVAQERVDIPSRSLPTWTGQDWECFPYLFDVSPYGLAEKVVSPHVRLSPSEILNVKQGARIATVWILDDTNKESGG